MFVTPTYGHMYDRVIGAGIRFATGTKDEYGKWHNSKVNHTGIYVGDGKIVEAKPNGAALSDWDTYGTNAHWSIGGMGYRKTDGTLAPLKLTDAQRLWVAAEAKKLVGVPYGFLDIVAIALAQQRLDSRVDVRKALAEQPWWVQRIEDMHTLICSQLVDTAYANADQHLFEDGRLPGLVSPNDIYGLFL